MDRMDWKPFFIPHAMAYSQTFVQRPVKEIRDCATTE
jgi:hypothetical protein